MFDASLYGPAYLQGMLLLTLLTAVIYAQGRSKEDFAVGYNAFMLWALAIVYVLFIGRRPISGVYFVDMSTYAMKFDAMSNGIGNFQWNDPGFNFLTEICARMMTTEGYFTVCVAIYTVTIAIAARRIHSPRWAFAAFLAFAGGFSFYSYSVNGIRNGMATSILLMAFAFRDRKLAMLLLMAAAVSMHKSVALPAIAFLITGFYAAPWFFATVWSLAFLASVTLRESLSTRISGLVNLGDGDDRLSTYIANTGLGEDKGGFRADFLLYSIVPVILSYALAGPAIRKDTFYRRIVCTYLLSNAIWLCLMYAAFSNRFAYLSWFVMPWICLYPFIPKKGDLVPPASTDKLLLLSAGLIAHYAFTYIMMAFVYGVVI